MQGKIQGYEYLDLTPKPSDENPDSNMSYSFQYGFFNDFTDISYVYRAFKECFEYLKIPMRISLVFDEDSPDGKIVFEPKDK